MRKKTIPTLGYGLILAVVVAGYTHCEKQQSGRLPAFAAPVVVENAATMDVPVELRQIGTVEAQNSVAVTARVGGQLLHVAFAEGANVNVGDVLFQIDPAPFRAALAQARAACARDQAILLNAASDVARYKDLAQKEYVTRQTFDAAVAAQSEAEATVAADSAALENARLNLAYCTIRSPLSGRSGPVLIKKGNLVVANASAPLVTINQIVPINVRFTVAENMLGEIRSRKSQDTLTVWAFIPPDSAKVYWGWLMFVDNQVDQATGTVLLKATFSNVEGALWPGQFVQTGLVLSTMRRATVVASAAVQTSQQGDYVYVVAPGDTAAMRPIERGASFQRWVVVTKGVVPGERVVTDGQLGIRQGSKVATR